MKKQFKTEVFVSRNTSIIADIFADNLKRAVKRAKDIYQKAIIDDNNGGWVEVEDGQVIAGTKHEYLYY